LRAKAATAFRERLWVWQMAASVDWTGDRNAKKTAGLE
jgi:hypothetical protein